MYILQTSIRFHSKSINLYLAIILLKIHDLTPLRKNELFSNPLIEIDHLSKVHVKLDNVCFSDIFVYGTLPCQMDDQSTWLDIKRLINTSYFYTKQRLSQK